MREEIERAYRNGAIHPKGRYAVPTLPLDAHIDASFVVTSICHEGTDENGEWYNHCSKIWT